MKTLLGAAFARCVIVLSLFVVTTAHADPKAQDPARADRRILARDADGGLQTRDDLVGFGAPRQWVFSTDAELSFRRSTLTNVDGATTSLSIAPGIDYFVLPNLSLGGGVGIFYDKTGELKSARFIIGPRVGYNFEVSRLFSLWPKLGLSYQHTTQRVAVLGSDKANGLALNLFAPLMFHPAKHFIAGFGPFLDADLSGAKRSTSWGVKLTLGGWLDSKPKPSAPVPPIPQK